jgi:SAM-dependent methyltransferase
VHYAILVSPSANRVYAQQACALTRAELAVVSECGLDGEIREITDRTLGSVEYVTFSGPELSPRALAWLSNLSGTLALFRLEGELLAPLTLARWDRLDSDLVSIQKYSGKTNEHFTKLLLNVTLAAGGFVPGERPLSLLDPLCGRGTTLNQALTYGMNATGVELDRKDFEAYASFIERYVKDKRLKHDATRGHVKGHPKLDLNFALDKARYKAGELLRLCYVSADTHAIADVFQPRSFDLIVTDAPYGVQHGAHSPGAEAPQRKPLELLQSAVPVWRAVLRSGGALGLSWNTRVAPRAAVSKTLTEAGLEVRDSEPFRAFSHYVDSSIQRDLIVARAP